VSQHEGDEHSIDKGGQVLDEIQQDNRQIQDPNEVFANPTGLGAMLDETASCWSEDGGYLGVGWWGGGLRGGAHATAF
jgi:hypothetical protein